MPEDHALASADSNEANSETAPISACSDGDALRKTKQSKIEREIETEREAAAAIGVSLSTLRRMIYAGDFPKSIQLSPRRKGVVIAQRKAWVAARVGEAA